MKISAIDRTLGCLYASASGDALGVPSSFQTPEHIKEMWGWIDTFYPPEKGHIFHDGLKCGEYTDDTEQSLALAASFIRNKRVVPLDIVNEILLWADRVRDKYKSPLGPSTERALKAIKGGADISVSGRYGNTNGSAMRISPLGIIHGLRNSTLEELVRDVHLTCLPTHNTDACISTASAIAWAVALAMRGEENISRIISGSIKASEEGMKYGYRIVTPNIGKRISIIYELVLKYESDPPLAMARIYELFAGGDVAADSIPVALGLFALGKGDVRRVNEYSVNFGGDADTNAAMAGAIAGAYSGIANVPKEWIETIESVNHPNMRDHAEALISIVPFWTVAE